jgi:hypothetical protein
MAGRIRSIKPEILEDEKTAALSHLQWRLFVSLWLIADDYGNLRGEPGYVQGQTLWAANETRGAVAGALDALTEVGLLTRYVVRGQTYHHITGWLRHQKVDKPGKPRMPGPDDPESVDSSNVATVLEIVAGSSRESRETLAPDRDQRPGPTTSEISPSARAIPSTPVPTPEPAPSRAPAPIVPAVSPPSQSREDIARTQGAGRPSVTRAEIVESVAGPYSPDDPRARGRLAEATYRRVSDALVAVAGELKLPAPLPFPAITPGSHPQSLRELQDRVREEGAAAPLVCDRVVANLIAQAREERSVEWLAEKTFSARPWAAARQWMPGAAARRRGPAKGDPLPPAPAPKRAASTPALVIPPDEREDVAAMARELRDRLNGTARAPPRSAAQDPPDQQPHTEAKRCP